MPTVWVIRALPDGADSRVDRWREIYSDRRVRLVTWGGSQSPDGVRIPGRPAMTSRWMSLCYPWFMLSVLLVGLLRFRRGDRVVCIDLEALLAAWWAAVLHGAEIHFDVADPFHLAKPVPCKRFWCWLEGLCIANVDLATSPHASRFLFYTNIRKGYRLVVENVPLLDVSSPVPFQAQIPPLMLGYFGALEPHRGLEDLIDLVKSDERLALRVAGHGALSPLIQDAASECPRIVFTGRFRSEQLPELVGDVHVYCSLYYGSKPLHDFACPNKFYEHLALGRPILISRRVPMAADVLKHQSGWVVEEDGAALIAQQLAHIDVVEVVKKAANAKRLWQERYVDYYSQVRKEMGL